MKRLCLLISFIISSYLSFSQSATWSVKFADAMISRYQPTINAMTGKGWEYSNTIILHGMEKVFKQAPTYTTYQNYIQNYVNTYVDSSGPGAEAANNQLYEMISAAGGIVYLGSLSSPALGAGNDLTSCVFTYVLPVRWLGFTAAFIKQKGVELKWDVTEDDNIRQYYVERSTDAKKWRRIDSIQKGIHPYAPHIQYNYTDYDYRSGKIFYRIIGEDIYGEIAASQVKQMIIEDQGLIISPNPAKDILIVKQKIAGTCQLDIYDSFGKLMLSTEIKNSTETINISKLFKGNYFLKLSADGVETAHSSFIKL